MKALIIGGTGPTGPDIVRALQERTYDVTVLHRGLHEPEDEQILTEVEHLHADPHFRESLEQALAGRSFDTIIATYGRMRLNTDVCAQRCDRFIGIGGNPLHPGMLTQESTRPRGMRILAQESDPPMTAAVTRRDRFAVKVAEAEQAVLDAHNRGDFRATYLRYPVIYGRRTWLAFEKGLVRRALAGRTRIMLPYGGLSIYSRCADRNAAAFVAGVLDHADIAAGQVYSCADDEQFSLAQWAELVYAALGLELEICSVPLVAARSAWNLLPTGPLGSAHTLVDTNKAKHDLEYADVVAPQQALTDLVRWLAADPQRTASIDVDTATEEAIMATYDVAYAQLVAQFDWRHLSEDDERDWHPYDHPHPRGDIS